LGPPEQPTLDPGLAAEPSGEIHRCTEVVLASATSGPDQLVDPTKEILLTPQDRRARCGRESVHIELLGKNMHSERNVQVDELLEHRVDVASHR
jgi:hypothetical protein